MSQNERKFPRFQIIHVFDVLPNNYYCHCAYQRFDIVSYAPFIFGKIVKRTGKL